MFHVSSNRGPQPLALQGRVLWKTVIPWTQRSRVGVREGSGDNVSDKQQQIKKASLAGPPLTSCGVASFLTGYAWVVVHGSEFGDPCFINTPTSIARTKKVSNTMKEN